VSLVLEMVGGAGEKEVAAAEVTVLVRVGGEAAEAAAVAAAEEVRGVAKVVAGWEGMATVMVMAPGKGVLPRVLVIHADAR
jgi:hypothetical protein